MCSVLDMPLPGLVVQTTPPGCIGSRLFRGLEFRVQGLGFRLLAFRVGGASQSRSGVMCSFPADGATTAKSLQNEPSPSFCV